MALRHDEQVPLSPCRDGRPVLVGVNASRQAEPTLRQAVDVARRSGAWLVVAHVVEPPPTAAVWAAALGAPVSVCVDDALEVLVRAAAVLDAQEVPWRPVVRRGLPALILNRLAEELKASTIVVGPGRPPRWWSGSGACARLQRLSDRPVIVANA